MSLFSVNASSTVCPKKRTPGMGQRAYATTFTELDGFPDTKYDIAIAGAQTPVNGDKKRLGEAFTYRTGGFHREFGILVDSGDAANNSTGELGSLMNEGIFRAFIEGDADDVREFIDCCKELSGCLQLVLPTKSGKTVSLGTPDYPVYLRSYSGGTGGGQGDAKVGYNVEFYTGHPDTYFSIDTTEFPLGLVAAV